MTRLIDNEAHSRASVRQLTGRCCRVTSCVFGQNGVKIVSSSIGHQDACASSRAVNLDRFLANMTDLEAVGKYLLSLLSVVVVYSLIQSVRFLFNCVLKVRRCEGVRRC